MQSEVSISMPWKPTLRAGGERLSAIAVYLLAFSAFFIPVGVASATVLLWLSVLLAPPPRAWLRQPAALLAVLLGAHALLCFALRHDDPRAPATWAATWDWLQLITFIPYAAALAAVPQRLARVLLLAILGLVLGMLWRVDWEALHHAPSAYLQARAGFGFPAIAFGLYSTTALLGLVLGQHLMLQSVPRGGRWLAGLGLILSAALLAQGLFMTQSRGSWLACAIVLAVAGVWLWRQCRQRGTWCTQEGLILGVVGVVLLLNVGVVEQRFAQEADTAAALVTHAGAADPQSSLAVRWAAQQVGLSLWQERPWLGWGPGTTPQLIEQAPQRDALVSDGQRLRHLHNTYLEILVQLGVVGLVLTAALGAALLYHLWQAHAQRRLAPELSVFLTLSLVLLALWCTFDFRALHQDWRTYWILLAGAVLSRAMPQPTAESPRA